MERALIQVGGAVRVTRNPDEVATSRCVVFPGQGAFGAITKRIVEGQMGSALRMVIERGDPFLGICLGMQLLFERSDENKGQKGLGILPGRCRRFPDGMEVGAESGAEEIEPSAAAPKADTAHAQTMADESSPDPFAMAAEPSDPGVSEAPASPQTAETVAPPEPHLVRRLKVPHMGWNSVEPTGDHYYFVHSYYVEACNSDDVMWMTTYGGIRFPAAVRRNNILGCQFHPEKSQRAGLKFLRAFLLGGGG